MAFTIPVEIENALKEFLDDIVRLLVTKGMRLPKDQENGFLKIPDEELSKDPDCQVAQYHYNCILDVMSILSTLKKTSNKAKLIYLFGNKASDYIKSINRLNIIPKIEDRSHLLKYKVNLEEIKTIPGIRGPISHFTYAYRNHFIKKLARYVFSSEYKTAFETKTTPENILYAIHQYIPVENLPHLYSGVRITQNLFQNDINELKYEVKTPSRFKTDITALIADRKTSAADAKTLPLPLDPAIENQYDLFLQAQESIKQLEASLSDSSLLKICETEEPSFSINSRYVLASIQDALGGSTTHPDSILNLINRFIDMFTAVQQQIESILSQLKDHPFHKMLINPKFQSDLSKNIADLKDWKEIAIKVGLLKNRFVEKEEKVLFDVKAFMSSSHFEAASFKEHFKTLEDALNEEIKKEPTFPTSYQHMLESQYKRKIALAEEALKDKLLFHNVSVSLETERKSLDTEFKEDPDSLVRLQRKLAQLRTLKSDNDWRPFIQHSDPSLNPQLEIFRKKPTLLAAKISSRDFSLDPLIAECEARIQQIRAVLNENLDHKLAEEKAKKEELEQALHRTVQNNQRNKEVYETQLKELHAQLLLASREELSSSSTSSSSSAEDKSMADLNFKITTLDGIIRGVTSKGFNYKASQPEISFLKEDTILNIEYKKFKNCFFEMNSDKQAFIATLRVKLGELEKKRRSLLEAKSKREEEEKTLKKAKKQALEAKIAAHRTPTDEPVLEIKNAIDFTALNIDFIQLKTKVDRLHEETHRWITRLNETPHPSEKQLSERLNLIKQQLQLKKDLLTFQHNIETAPSIQGEMKRSGEISEDKINELRNTLTTVFSKLKETHHAYYIKQHAAPSILKKIDSLNKRVLSLIESITSTPFQEHNQSDPTYACEREFGRLQQEAKKIQASNIPTVQNAMNELARQMQSCLSAIEGRQCTLKQNSFMRDLCCLYPNPYTVEYLQNAAEEVERTSPKFCNAHLILSLLKKVGETQPPLGTSKDAHLINQKRQAQIILSVLLPRINNVKDLLSLHDLIATKHLGAENPYGFIRKERGWFRSEYGNTKTWEHVLLSIQNALHNQIVRHLSENKQVTLTATEYRKFYGIMASKQSHTYGFGWAVKTSFAKSYVEPTNYLEPKPIRDLCVNASSLIVLRPT